MIDSKFLVTADLHLRVSKPRCRTVNENWMERQESVLKQIVEKANELKCPLYILGDIFNTINDVDWQLLNLAIQMFNSVEEGAYLLVGNHDAKWKSLDLLEQSPIGVVLKTVPHLRTIENAYDFEEEKEKGFVDKKQVMTPEAMFIHRLVFKSEKDKPIEGIGDTAQSLLEEFPKAKVIFAGDTHKGFEYVKNGRSVLVPGCPIRQTADLIDYIPHVCYVVNGNVEKSYEIDDGEIINDYLIEQAQRDSRVSVVIESLKNQGGFTLDFIENCRKALREGELEEEVKSYILGKIG